LISHPKGRKQTEVFENRVPRRTFGPRREEATGDWRKLNDEELHNLYYSPYQFKEDGMGGVCSTNGGQEKCIYILVGIMNG
jgi:hypothetical protein